MKYIFFIENHWKIYFFPEKPKYAKYEGSRSWNFFQKKFLKPIIYLNILKYCILE